MNKDKDENLRRTLHMLERLYASSLIVCGAIARMLFGKQCDTSTDIKIIVLLIGFGLPTILLISMQYYKKWKRNRWKRR